MYRGGEGELASTGDSWYINRGEGITRAEYVLASSQRAVQYIGAYYQRNGSAYWYGLVVKCS